MRKHNRIAISNAAPAANRVPADNFTNLHSRLAATLQPENAFEREWVFQIAIHQWRLKRLAGGDSETINLALYRAFQIANHGALRRGDGSPAHKSSQPPSAPRRPCIVPAGDNEKNPLR